MQAAVPQSVIDYIFNDELQEKLSSLIFKINKRVDGRDFTTVRPISVEVGLITIHSWFSTVHSWKHTSACNCNLAVVKMNKELIH